MTVCHVYWLFDAMVAHIRMTSPYGSDEDDDDESTSTTSSTLSSPQLIAGAIQNSGLHRGPIGITKYDNVDQVRSKDPHLADAITDTHFLSLLED